MKWVLSLGLLLSMAAFGVSYSELRNAEAKRMKAFFDSASPEGHYDVNGDAYQKALSEETEARHRLAKPLVDLFGKLDFGPNYDVKSEASPNLFIRGNEDSYCYEGISLDITAKKTADKFAGYLTSEMLLRDADEELMVEVPSWNREKGNGVENSPDASAILTQIYCNGASHTVIKKMKSGPWLVQVTQDEVTRPSHLIGLRRVKDKFLFVKSELPKGFGSKLSCSKKFRPEKAQIKCLKEEVSDKMLEPFAKKVLDVLGAFQVS